METCQHLLSVEPVLCGGGFLQDKVGVCKLVVSKRDLVGQGQVERERQRQQQSVQRHDRMNPQDQAQAGRSCVPEVPVECLQRLWHVAEGGSYPLVVVVHLEKCKTITTVHVCTGHLTSLSKARHKRFSTTLDLSLQLTGEPQCLWGCGACSWQNPHVTVLSDITVNRPQLKPTMYPLWHAQPARAALPTTLVAVLWLHGLK